MASVYDDYYNQALNLQNHFNDVVDNQFHPQYYALKNEIHGLVDDFKSQKEPRYAEDRLKIIDHQLLQARTYGEQIMSYQDLEAMQHQYRRLHENIKRMQSGQ
jgi:hypothetical protein